jgi:hypothetical protein
VNVVDHDGLPRSLLAAMYLRVRMSSPPILRQHGPGVQCEGLDILLLQRLLRVVQHVIISAERHTVLGHSSERPLKEDFLHEGRDEDIGPVLSSYLNITF